MSFNISASGEDPQCTTPKSRKNDMGHYSHPTTPQSTVPSPGAASMNSMHEEYGDMSISSPSWPRTPASPVSSVLLGTVVNRKRKKRTHLSHSNLFIDHVSQLYQSCIHRLFCGNF